ncbi:MAG: alpha/beta hydrolase [Nitrosomonas sp.]|nr:alpha/beta hydrolase [Nitrosomonas sp.]
MPALQRFSARDGTELAYRHYPARGANSGRIAILVHGSSGSSVAVHALADALAARGVATWAPDIRGHGGSGTRGRTPGFARRLHAPHKPARRRVHRRTQLLPYPA